MGQKVSTSSNRFRNLFPFKTSPPKQPHFTQNPADPSAELTAPPRDFLPLVSSCISAASTRTREYLVFKDPEEKFHPSPQVFTQVFLMTYMSQSFSLNLTGAFSCTLMTPEQRVLLGADWVWAVLDKPTNNPKIQIAVRVVHLPGRENREEDEAKSESVQMARVESSSKNGYERMVEFCASVGRDCYALFLLFGRNGDGGNVYGVLSNNMEVAVAKCKRIDRALVEDFFKGSKSFHNSSDMMRSIVNNKKSEALTLTVKFS